MAAGEGRDGHGAKRSFETATARCATRRASLELDRYLAALLVAASARAGLIALAAFLGEIARIPATVQRAGDGRHPPAMVARGADRHAARRRDRQSRRRRHARRRCASTRCPREMLVAMIDAYAHSSSPARLTHRAAVDAYADATQGAAFRLAAHILGVRDVAAAELMLAAAAQSYGRVQLLRALPALVSQGPQSVRR